MKLLFITTVFIVTITFANSSMDDYDVNSLKHRELTKYAVIHKLYEMLRDLIKTGSEEHDVPIWDPYQFHYTTLDISGKWYSIMANITDGTLSGLGDFYVPKCDFNDEDMSLDNKIIFPQLKFTADYYEMEGALWGAIPLAGRGKIDVEVHYITSISKVYLKPSNDGKSILIDKVENPRFNVEKIISNTEFDKNFDDILNRMIADLLAGYLTRFNGLITNLYTEQLVDFMNSILGKFETWYILATIM